MPTERQIAANRLNAQKSTGPRTEQGRAAVRHNAVKHGLCAKTLVLPDEDVAEFHALLEGLEETFQPANPGEVILVRQMALAAWRLNRACHIEGAFFHFELKSDAKTGMRDQYHPDLDLYGKLAYLIQDESNGRKLSTLVRYQAHFERSYYRAMSALERVQAKRTATVRERPLRDEQPLRDESESQNPTSKIQYPPSPIGSVSQKRKQPIPINEITHLALPSETCIQSNPCHEPSPPAEPGSES